VLIKNIAARKSRRSYSYKYVLIKKKCIILITVILIKKIGQSCNGDHNIGLVSLSVQKMDGAYKKMLGLYLNTGNLGLKTVKKIFLEQNFEAVSIIASL